MKYFGHLKNLKRTGKATDIYNNIQGVNGPIKRDPDLCLLIICLNLLVFCNSIANNLNTSPMDNMNAL